MELTKQQIKQVERLTGFKRLTEKQFRKLVYKAAKEYNKQFGYTEEFEEQESNGIVESIIKQDGRGLKRCFIKTDGAEISTDDRGYFVANLHLFIVDGDLEFVEEGESKMYFEYTAMCSGDPISKAFPLKGIIGLSSIFGEYD